MGTTIIQPSWAPLERPRVVVASELDGGRSLVVDRTVLVGTSDRCDLQLGDRTVSRRHLTLSPGGLGVVVRDQGSRNGTWLGEVRVTEVEVPAGQELRLGSTLLRVERDLQAVGDSPLVEPVAPTAFGRFLGEAPCLAPLYATLQRAAATDVTVLLEGESGTGKELLAEAIHEQSARRNGPFIVVDCGAMSQTLIESELFGHERGAFTGADRARSGAFEAASGGTIFLDEIGELDQPLQTRLLRVLDQRKVKRLGSQRVLDLDLRVVAATNRNLEREVEESRFRLDLFHRLAVALIRVPPLREREGDIERLARHFIAQCGADPTLLSIEALRRLEAHNWPGNVRELRNHIERLALFGEGAAQPPTRQGSGDLIEQIVKSGSPYRQARATVLERFAERYVLEMLARHGGNVSQAARAAGVARRHFQRLKQQPGGRPEE